MERTTMRLNVTDLGISKVQVGAELLEELQLQDSEELCTQEEDLLADKKIYVVTPDLHARLQLLDEDEGDLDDVVDQLSREQRAAAFPVKRRRGGTAPQKVSLMEDDNVVWKFESALFGDAIAMDTEAQEKKRKDMEEKARKTEEESASGKTGEQEYEERYRAVLATRAEPSPEIKCPSDTCGSCLDNFDQPWLLDRAARFKAMKEAERQPIVMGLIAGGLVPQGDRKRRPWMTNTRERQGQRVRLHLQLFGWPVFVDGFCAVVNCTPKTVNNYAHKIGNTIKPVFYRDGYSRKTENTALRVNVTAWVRAYAQQHGTPCPCGDLVENRYFLSSDTKKLDLYKKYKRETDALIERRSRAAIAFGGAADDEKAQGLEEFDAVAGVKKAASQSSFYDIRDKHIPDVRIITAGSDFCELCTTLKSAAYRKEREAELKQHIDRAIQERSLYRGQVLQAVRSNGQSVHFAFDYAENVVVPKLVKEPQSYYWASWFRLYLFGLCSQSLGINNLFVIPEHVFPTTGVKGSEAVISMLHHVVADRAREASSTVSFHADNCGGQNKNKFMLMYMCTLSILGNVNVGLSFMIAGHTKFYPDACFGAVKKEFHRSDVMSPVELCDIIDRVNKNNSAVNVEEALTDKRFAWYAWKGFLEQFFTIHHAFRIQASHIFRFSKSQLGNMLVKAHSTDTEGNVYRLLKPRITSEMVRAAVNDDEKQLATLVKTDAESSGHEQLKLKTLRDFRAQTVGFSDERRGKMKNIELEYGKHAKPEAKAWFTAATGIAVPENVPMEVEQEEEEDGRDRDAERQAEMESLRVTRN